LERINQDKEATMKLSDYKKVLDELSKLGYPVREMTATDTWLMWKAFKRN
jgi:hypothetical protein